MAIDDNIREEKLQDDVNRAAAKKPALSPGKIDQFKQLAGEEIVQHDEGRMINKLSLYIFHQKQLYKSKQKRLKIKKKANKSN